MSNLQAPEFPAMVFFIRDNRRTSFDTECPECQYVYPNEKIKKHMCDILDYIKCKGCKHHYRNEAMKRHIRLFFSSLFNWDQESKT